MKYFVLKKRIIYVILIGVIFVSLSCSGKDTVKPSQDSLMAAEAISSINIIKSAYQEKDRDTLQSHLGDAIAEGIIEQLFFERAELSIAPRMIKIDGSTVVVDVNWQGAWMLKNERLKDRGIAALVFDGSPMKLMRVDGDSPFQTPVIKD